ncbi:hypothetical protein [Candidatus Accumulibacter sp. ACC005]|uniref:hypothetical protein n=1 Tax=Candidatus Accumulibacter sp. ACC005 TaxID=2823331 RepID=UPI0025C33B92|nr:hypothetical protein [Candidatus Accumulibacter sp. ACC005]
MGGDVLSDVGKRLGDLSDLPEALRKQLNAAKMGDLEEKILRTIKERYDGAASIDEIMVGLFRDFQYVTEDRRTMANRLYRMTKAGHLESVPKRKGVVKLKE